MSEHAEKIAFLKGLIAGAKRLAPGVGGRLHSAHLGGNIATKGTKATMLNYAKGGAGLGGVLGAGFGALGAEEGHRWEGALRGGAAGAAQGAIGGAVSGAVNQPLRNMRQHAMASRYGAPAAEKALNSTWRGNIKGMFGKPGAVPRGAHAMEFLAAPATLAADMAIGDVAMSAQEKLTNAVGLGEKPPPPPSQPQLQQFQQQTPEQMGQRPPGIPNVRTASVRIAGVLDVPPQPAIAEPETVEPPRKVEPFLVAPFTSTAGKILSDKVVHRVHPKMPEGALRKHILPTIGATALTIPAVKAIRAYNEAQAPTPPNPIDELDIDALKTYFGKQPATQGDQHADRNH